MDLLDELFFEVAHLALGLRYFLLVVGRNFRIIGCWLGSFILHRRGLRVSSCIGVLRVIGNVIMCDQLYMKDIKALNNPLNIRFMLYYLRRSW